MWVAAGTPICVEMEMGLDKTSKGKERIRNAIKH